MSMDRTSAMSTFVRVVELGSFSAAARALRLGQPAVSKLVASLERELGVRLLARSAGATRAVRPTEAGAAFYARARLALEAAEEAWAAARGTGASLEGLLRVSAPVTFARLHLVPRLGAFLAAHPRLSLELVMEDRVVHLAEAYLDLALRLGPITAAGGTARKLAEGDRLVVASTGYLARRGAPAAPEALADHDVIVYAQAVGGQEWRFRRGDEERSVRVASRLAFSAAEGVREAVISGLGLAIASRWMMAPELASGTVVPVLESWRLPPLDLWALFPDAGTPGAKAVAFVDWYAPLLRAASR
jgi:DNA-binding transcriptional LysR family regulator